jgi:hypothetical protein
VRNGSCSHQNRSTGTPFNYRSPLWLCHCGTQSKQYGDSPKTPSSDTLQISMCQLEYGCRKKNITESRTNARRHAQKEDQKDLSNYSESPEAPSILLQSFRQCRPWRRAISHPGDAIVVAETLGRQVQSLIRCAPILCARPSQWLRSPPIAPTLSVTSYSSTSRSPRAHCPWRTLRQPTQTALQMCAALQIRACLWQTWARIFFTASSSD